MLYYSSVPDEEEDDSVSANTSVHAGFISANTSLVMNYRSHDASCVSDTDYESAAEADNTDHDLSFDGKIVFVKYFISPIS